MKISASERLEYRLMTLDDADLLLELDQDPLVMKYISNGVPTSPDDMHNILIPRLAKYLSPEKGWGIWQVNIVETNEYIGWVLVRPMHYFSANVEFDNLELGWRFKRQTWGKGYASEAAKHIMECFHQQQRIGKFCAIALKDNVASTRVMQKIGMRFEKSYFHQDPIFTEEVDYYSKHFP